MICTFSACKTSSEEAAYAGQLVPAESCIGSAP
eukprot:COSAG01_NODE_449_length_16915_cov_23.001903_12_plen_33_part_00